MSKVNFEQSEKSRFSDGKSGVLQCQKLKESFTVIELIVVMAIIGILALITVGGIKQALPYWQLEGTVVNLQKDYRLTQQQAVDQQRVHLLYIYSVEIPAYYQIIRSDDQNIVKTIYLPSNIKINPEAGREEISFNAEGAPSSSGNIALSNEKGQIKTVNISPAGQIKVLK